MAQDLEVLKNSVAPIIKLALADLKKDTKDRFSEIELEIKNTLIDIVDNLDSGESLQKIADRYDTKTQALVAVAFLKLSAQQTRALKKIGNVLEQINNLVLRTLLLKLIGL